MKITAKIANDIGSKYLAKTTRDMYISIDHMPPLSRHNMILLKKNSIVGINEDLEMKDGWTSNAGLTMDPPNAKVASYISSGDFLFLTLLTIKDLKDIQDLNGNLIKI